MKTHRLIHWFAVLVLVIVLSPTNVIAGEKKVLTFAAIATEEMAVVTERWQPTIKYISKNAGVEINSSRRHHMPQRSRHC